VFSGWIEADPSPDQQHWGGVGGGFEFVRGRRNSIQWIEKWLHGETRAWLWM